MLEGVFPVWFDDIRGGILERLLRLSRCVSPDVQLGYHFCYGDVQHRHFKEPADAGKLVDVANALAASLGRPLNWIHLPVPRERLDEAYYAPLRELRLRPETELYLGLVHHTDGVDGTVRRMEVARGFVSNFRIATECAWGLRLRARVVGMLVVDSSSKFLRVAFDKFGDEERVAFRLLRWLKQEQRLELLEEVIGPELQVRKPDPIASTNAIHLYRDLPDTLA